MLTSVWWELLLPSSGRLNIKAEGYSGVLTKQEWTEKTVFENSCTGTCQGRLEQYPAFQILRDISQETTSDEKIFAIKPFPLLGKEDDAKKKSKTKIQFLQEVHHVRFEVSAVVLEKIHIFWGVTFW